MGLRKKHLRYLILYLFVIAGAVAMIFPFLWMISNAFKANVFVIEYPPRLIPENPSFDNFVEA